MPRPRPKRRTALDHPTPPNVVFIPGLTFPLPLTLLNTGTTCASSLLPSPTRCFHSVRRRNGNTKIPAAPCIKCSCSKRSVTYPFASASASRMILGRVCASHLRVWQHINSTLFVYPARVYLESHSATYVKYFVPTSVKYLASGWLSLLFQILLRADIRFP
jgi:hypothetical protein